MTLDQALLAALIAVTALGTGVATVTFWRQGRWRRLDLLKELIDRWANQTTLPDGRDIVHFQAVYARAAVENDARFALALKLVPMFLRRQYEEFVRVRSVFIEACQRLHWRICSECETRTGVPVGEWEDVRNWPETVLAPNFPLSVFEQVLAGDRERVQPIDVSYDVESVSHTGDGFIRKKRSLRATYREYRQMELAQADEDSILEPIKLLHRQMMSSEYCHKLQGDVAEITRLRDKAESLASTVRKGIRRVLAS